ncbi:hypothetical protein EDD69_10514 [Thermolongibacillus altinsuensis]|uniref:Uncharacterized protein n=1 Tax=Thermolongibacillus altinsuensis TaxID=575256 RepID=A0A4R1QGD9_9BACL|nr:hypothetical protein [Thermolongibacillus altinsuensis]TCL50218.1 hypothetical protein EDD69_10514 [Thermolongibacillus altinsuensis]GMB08614.1 hypothetical protein B1no1_13240 [Thermolongibacillus altinsuensis]
MKEYVVFLLHMFIWNCFSIVEWLSARDRPIFKAMLFIIFVYVAFLLALRFRLQRKKAFWTTIASITIYFVCRQAVWHYLL